jgi:hypothetical protein
LVKPFPGERAALTSPYQPFMPVAFGIKQQGLQRFHIAVDPEVIEVAAQPAA